MSSKEALNLPVLQRLDPLIQQVLSTAGHVTLYVFNTQIQTWEKKEIEGSLFIVKRSQEPLFQFIVMNRLNTKNMIEEITNNFQIQISEPYLLYRNTLGEINGIWFYNPAEREKVCTILGKIVEWRKTNDPSVLQSITGEQAPAPFNPLTKLLAANVQQNRATIVPPTNSQVVSREQFKAALMRLSQDDQFVDLVYKEYLNVIQ